MSWFEANQDLALVIVVQYQAIYQKSTPNRPFHRTIAWSDDGKLEKSVPLYSYTLRRNFLLFVHFIGLPPKKYYLVINVPNTSQ